MYLFKCSYCGFNNITSLESIDEDDICAVEKFVREELEDFIKTNADFTKDDTNLLKKQRMIDHFGEFYAQCPKKFCFLPGDRKFIQKIQKHLHDVFNKKGRKKASRHFNKKISYVKKSANVIKHTSTEVNNIDKLTSSDCSDNGLKTKLYNLVSDKLIEFGVPASTVELFDESFISIVNENSKITGNVVCIVCHEQSENIENVKPKQVYCRGKSWVISNLMKHFKRAHPQLVRQKNININTMENAVDIEKKISIGKQFTEYVTVEEVDPMTFEMNYSTKSLEDFIASETSEMEKKFNDEISTQLIKMWTAVTQYGESHEQKVKCMCDSGVSVSFDVANILKDGDCLFGALAHQIYRNNLNSVEHQEATRKLRQDVVDYINTNYEEFQQYLQGHVYDLHEAGHSELYGLHEIDDMDLKCKHLLNELLINPGFWASGESLRAIACLHDVNIIVFYENGPIYAVNKTGELSKQTVVIAYRKTRNHYDSVYSMSATDIYTTAKYISEILNTESGAQIDLVTSP